MIDSPICTRDPNYDEARDDANIEDKLAAPVSTRFKEHRRPPVVPTKKKRDGIATMEQDPKPPAIATTNPSTLYGPPEDVSLPTALIELSNEYHEKFVKSYAKDVLNKE
ncbi:hypothetical protein EVJ58_g11133 [Rhodofomes roseus]|uniref:Uncharacterized protein n=1 Tax=Rhodofomes roseus TaxID=34475 RepID=A0A4Y9XJV7_9APHY|nr:hypothetical protein EVJ58_g11133 [Rhodofomes roseus]